MVLYQSHESLPEFLIRVPYSQLIDWDFYLSGRAESPECLPVVTFAFS